jgi:hypothetical protein
MLNRALFATKRLLKSILFNIITIIRLSLYILTLKILLACWLCLCTQAKTMPLFALFCTIFASFRFTGVGVLKLTPDDLSHPLKSTFKDVPLWVNLFGSEGVDVFVILGDLYVFWVKTKVIVV